MEHHRAGQVAADQQAERALPTVRDPSVAHRAADALFGRPLLQEPVWSAQRVSADDVAAVARQLFGEVDPHGPSAAKVLTEAVRPFFPKSILQPMPSQPPLGYTLAETVLNGWPLYLQGAARGVGSSYLALKYADQFNRSARAAGDPRNAAHVRILPRTRTQRQFIDALAVGLRAPLTSSELRFRSPSYLGYRILATAAQRRTTCLVLDHVHHLDKEAREVLADLVQLLNPDNHLSDADTGSRPFPRVGVVMVSHRPAEQLFVGDPDVVATLEGRTALLLPYTDWRQVGEALELADIGVGRFNPDDEDDQAMAKFILEKTSGLVEQMNPFFARMRLIARRKEWRPNAAVASAVLPYQRKLIELRERLADAPGGREYEARVVRSKPTKRPRPWLPAGSPDEKHEQAALDAARKRMEQRRGAGEPGDGHTGLDEDDGDEGLDDGTDEGTGGGVPADGPRSGPRGGRSGAARRPRTPRAEALANKRKEQQKTAAVHRKLKGHGYTNP